MIPQPSVIVVCSARTHACMLVLFEYVRTYVAILQSLYACMHTTVDLNLSVNSFKALLTKKG